MDFFFPPPHPDRLWGPNSLFFNGYEGALYPGVERPVVKLTNYFHLEPRLSINETITLHNPISLHGVVFSLAREQFYYEFPYCAQ